MKPKITKKTSGFCRGLLGYIIVYLIVASIGLVFFAVYLNVFEYTRMDTTIRRRLDQMDEEEFKALAAPTLAELDKGLYSEDKSTEFIRRRLENVTFSRKSEERTANSITYALRSDGRDIGRAVLTYSGEKTFGFPLWQLSSLTLDLRREYKRIDVALPAEYLLLFNGKELTDIAGEPQEYQRLKSFYADSDDIPLLIHYTSGSYLGDDTTQVCKADGSPVPMDALSEELFLNNCDERELKTLSAFAESFVEKYVAFTSNLNRDIYGNYWVLMKYVANGSDFQSRMEQAMGSLSFTHSYGTEILDTEVDLACALGDGRYLIEVSYGLEIVGVNGEQTRTDNRLRILLISGESGLLATNVETF